MFYLDNTDRRAWVTNNTDAYLAWQDSNQPLWHYIATNRPMIDRHIRAAVGNHADIDMADNPADVVAVLDGRC